jgi:SagB-type dehydrogenase family enzyme
LRAAKKRRERREKKPAALCARLGGHVALETRAGGEIFACFHGYAVALGKFTPGAARRAQGLRSGVPLASFASSRRESDREIDLLVRRLARRGLIEYVLRRAKDTDLVVVEPQVADYWPRIAPLGNNDTLVLSRFAYMRRRGNDLVLESPRAGALLRICDPGIAAALAKLATPQKIRQLRLQNGFPGIEFLALLVDCQMLFKLDAAKDDNLRAAEGGDELALWDFHDLLFHARSTEGRHANPLGGTYPNAGMIAPLPAIRPSWPGGKIDLRTLAGPPSRETAQVTTLLRRRHSTRSFDDKRPITLAELAQFLDGSARVLSQAATAADESAGIPAMTYTARPYPSAGASYELELYLAVKNCEGLARGFYHYDAGEHALTLIDVPDNASAALLTGAQYAMGADDTPQLVITIAARFGRVSWKYSALAYSLILKDAGVLLQTFYLTAAAMGLGGCAIGIANIDLFAKMTGIDFYVEGPLAQFALGRGAETAALSGEAKAGHNEA